MNDRDCIQQVTSKRPKLGFLFAPLLMSAAIFAQSGGTKAAVTFHLQGSVKYLGEDIPAAQAHLTFHNGKNEYTVISDSNGHYEADLPVGIYTLKATLLARSVTEEFDRPLFQVLAPSSLTLDIKLDPHEDCDYVLPPPGKPPPPEDKDSWICNGAQDSFPVSAGNVPFKIFIRYRSRKQDAGAFVYYTGKHPADFNPPVEVSYNLFTLYADTVTYRLQGRTIEASGNVVANWANGVTKRAETMHIKINNGQALLMR